MTGEGRKVVLGLGNTLNRDEGLGVCALEPLRALLGGRGEVELLDGGVLGMSRFPVGRMGKGMKGLLIVVCQMVPVPEIRMEQRY